MHWDVCFRLPYYYIKSHVEKFEIFCDFKFAVLSKTWELWPCFRIRKEYTEWIYWMNILNEYTEWIYWMNIPNESTNFQIGKDKIHPIRNHEYPES